MIKYIKKINVFILIFFLLCNLFLCFSVSADWFGNKDVRTSGFGIENIEYGSSYLFDFDGDYAFATDISVNLHILVASHDITCGIYNNDTKDLIAQTEIRSISVGGPRYERFNFTSLINLSGFDDTYLLLVVWSNATDGSSWCGKNDTNLYSIWDGEPWDTTLSNPFVKTNDNDNYHALIYCNYTISTTGNIVINRNSFISSILIFSSMGLISMFMFYKKKSDRRKE